MCCFRRHGACSCSSSEVSSAQGIAKEDPLPAVLESKSIPLVATRQHVKILILISMLTGHMQKQRRAHYGAGGNVAEIQLCWILGVSWTCRPVDPEVQTQNGVKKEQKLNCENRPHRTPDDLQSAWRRQVLQTER